MKKNLLFSISIFVALIFLAANILLPTSCKNGTQPLYWQELYTDKQWIQQLNQYLALSYTENNDKAAFSAINSNDLSPGFYSTCNIITILKSVGMKIENQNQIISYLNSTMNKQGAYVDPTESTTYINPVDETREAIEIINELGGKPEDVDSTVNYLLSLEYKDGTFLVEPETQLSVMENTQLNRIVNGTYSVVDSLIMLGRQNQIPQETKDVLVSAVVSALPEGNPFPSLTDSNTWSVITAIQLLTKIDPSLVPERAKELISYALNEVINIPPDSYIFTSSVNLLLDSAQSLNLAEANDKNILTGLRVDLNDKIFPLQNPSGGFGPSEIVEPLTTSDVVILANRLGVKYPNLNKLLSNIEEHRVDDGWTEFFEYTINNSNYLSTYYAIEIAKFSGYAGYDKKNVEKFLAGCFTASITGSNAVDIGDVYDAVMALKAMDNNLTQQESSDAKEICLELATNLLTAPQTNVGTDFAYILPISKEVGFDLPEDIQKVIPQLAGDFEEDLLDGQRTLVPYYLLRLWESLDENNTIITKDEAAQYLGNLYDEASGAYNTLALLNPQEPNTFTPHPEMFQTYSALEILSDIGESIPDENKTVEFVMSSKQEFGFSRAPDWSQPYMESTFAALMILKQLSH